MAVSVSSASALLHHNLILLTKFVRPGPRSKLLQCLKEGMFAQPNRSGFEEVMYYLLYAYDPRRCAAQVTWPLVERTHERAFRKDIAVYVKEIASERPEAKLPHFSPSFLTTPGGDRFVKFMWKLSLLVLKTVVDRSEVQRDTPLLEFPSRNYQLFQKLACREMEKLKHSVIGLSQLLIDGSRRSKEMCEKILKLDGDLKLAQANLKDVVEMSPLVGIKTAALGGDGNVYSSEINKEQSHLKSKLTEVIALHNRLKEHYKILCDCQNIVKQFIDSRSNPIVLDASVLYPNSKDPLKLADLMLESSQTVEEICQRLLECGGLQPIEHQVLPLNNVNIQLCNFKSDLRDTLSGFFEFLTELSVGTYELYQSREESPPRTLRLNDGYKLLEDAKLASPVIEFKIDTQLSPNCALDTESPPIGGVVDAWRAQHRRGAVNGNDAAKTPFSVRRPPLILANGNRSFHRSRIPGTPVASGVSAYSARVNMAGLRASTMIPISTQSSVKSSSRYLAVPTPAKLSLKPPPPVKSTVKSSGNGIGTFKPLVTSTLSKTATQHKFVKSKNVLQDSGTFSQASKHKVAGNKSGEVNMSAASVYNNVDVPMVNPRRLSIRSKDSDGDNSDLQEILDLVTETLSPNKALDDDDAVWLQSVSTKAPESSTSSPKVDFPKDVTPITSPAVDSDHKANRASSKKRDSLLKTVLSRSPSGSPRSPVSLGARKKSQPPTPAPLILGSSPIKCEITFNGDLVAKAGTRSMSPRVKSKILIMPQKTPPKIVVPNFDSNAIHSVENEPSEFDSPHESIPGYSFDASDGDMNGSLLMLDNDDEHTSPSGRLSWESEPVDVQELREETVREKDVQRVDQKEADETEVKSNLVQNITEGKPAAGERRRSLLAVIERYHKLVGTRSDREKHAKPELQSEPHHLESSSDSNLDSTAELGLSTHGIDIDLDLNL